MNQKEKGKKMMDLGRTKFIWRYGVCGWGLLTAMLFLVLEIIIEKRFNLSDLLSLVFLKQLLLAIVIFPCVGYFWGLLMWKSFEKRIGNKNQNER
jgi:hypothetical protein